MKKVTLLLLILTTAMTYSQVGINTDTPDASSALEIKSTSAGILIPRMTEAQRDAIASPALSLMIYQTNNDSGFYFFDGSAWKKIEGVAGPQGVAGTNGSDGQDGDSVYQIWLDAGNTGTEADFLNALKGTDGTNGTNGTNGQDGDSAYQIWLDAGNTGTEADFLNALKGTDGADGTNGTNGQDGDSAYQIWLNAGNTGTEADFLNSLKAESSNTTPPVYNNRFTSSDSYTIPEGVTTIFLEFMGTQGGTGGDLNFFLSDCNNPYQTRSGGSGGSAFVGKYVILVKPGDVISFNLGSNGTKPSISNTPCYGSMRYVTAYSAPNGSNGTSSELFINGALYATISGGGGGGGAYNNQGQTANDGAASTVNGSSSYSNSADNFSSMVVYEGTTRSQTPSVLIKH